VLSTLNTKEAGRTHSLLLKTVKNQSFKAKSFNFLKKQFPVLTFPCLDWGSLALAILA
jgi:hypothetical protein